MKRIICMILSVSLLFSMAACSQAKPEDDIISSDAEFSSIESVDESESETESSSEAESTSEPEQESSSASESSISSSSSSSLPSSSQPSQSSAPSEIQLPTSPSTPPPPASSSGTPAKPSPAPMGEVRAIWFSYLDIQPMLTGRTEAQFTSSINTAFDKIAGEGLNTIYAQVRSHSDAMYDSDYYPWSVYCAGTEGVSPGYDPLAVMVKAAHARGLRIEAWVNPYRIKSTTNTSKIAKSSPAYDWLDTNKVVVVNDVGIYYNPAYDEVIDLVVSGVKEIVKNYDVDGIHFDDYFYPTTDESFDKPAYTEYKNSGGGMSLGDWRRDNVNRLVEQVYAAVKSANSSCVFGISPTGNMDSNYSIFYCDIYAWVRSSKYIDYICPQIYFGFNHAYSSYTEVLDQYNSMISNSNIQLISGLAGYKIGLKEHSSAGGGVNEWVNNNDILARQVVAARKKSHYEGFALYRYDSLFNPAAAVSSAVKAERSNLEDVLK